MKDKLYIEELQIPCFIGIYAWEQAIKRTLIFNICIDMEASPAAKSDDISDALDYATLVNIIEVLVAGQSFNLIEHVAECVAERLLQEALIEKVTLKVQKQRPIPNTRRVAIEIVRGS